MRQHVISAMNSTLPRPCSQVRTCALSGAQPFPDETHVPQSLPSKVKWPEGGPRRYVLLTCPDLNHPTNDFSGMLM